MTTSDPYSASDWEEFILELMFMIQHELRVKFLRVKGYTELVGLTAPLADNQKELLQEALKNIDGIQNTLDKIYDEVKTFVHIQSERTVAVTEGVNLSPCIDEAIVLLPVEGDLTRQTVVRVRLPDLPPVKVKKQELTIVLKILIENTFRYLPPEEEIILMAKKLEKHVKIIITSGSIGSVTREDKSFEEQVQSIGLKEEEISFLSFNLTFAKDCVGAWGGEIGYEDDGGRGKFWFILPVFKNGV